MTKIDVFSGFLGAGKTTLIKKLLKEAFVGEKVVLVENEFGEIGIDGGFLRESGIEITEMNSGCICCSLVGDFEKALSEVIERFSPDRILIEPSGVGKLSDVVQAIHSVLSDEVKLGSLVTVADAGKCAPYMRNFGEFYNNQIATAGALILSRTDGIAADKLEKTIALLRQCNDRAVLVTTPWDQLDGAALWETIVKGANYKSEMWSIASEMKHKHHHHEEENHEECSCHHHHDHKNDKNEECHHHHEHGEECHCHEHEHEHHHKHGEECHCHEHEHHHKHGEECHCHEHEHHHHGHHADEVFSTFGRETARIYSKERIEALLLAFDAGACGFVLRAKGILPSEGGKWLHFDYVPGEVNVREGCADVIGRLCVIGKNLNEAALCELFDA